MIRPRRKPLGLNTPEPMPLPTEDTTAIWDLVILDIRQRDEHGTKKYGQRLMACDGRDSLIDAYQEALDLVVYLRKAIRERAIAKEAAK